MASVHHALADFRQFEENRTFSGHGLVEPTRFESNLRVGVAQGTIKMKMNHWLYGCALVVSLIDSRLATAEDPPVKAPAVAPIDPSQTPAAADNSAPTDQTIKTPEGDVHVNLPPGAKSVLKRPAADESVTVKAGYDPALVPVTPGKSVDSAVRQAGGVTPDNSNGSTSGVTTASATSAEIDEAQAKAAAAADLMAQALTAPKQGALEGRATTLLELMGRVGGDRTRQAWVVRDYWKLAAAQADFNWAADEAARLDQITAAKGLESPILTAAQAAAQARLREAQVAAITAQQELADLLGIADKAQMPMAADPPLVGPYRTYFDQLFAGKVAPPRTRAIDRGLPVRLEAIQSRTVAVHAAATAVRTAEDLRSRGQADLRTLLDCHADLSRQRRAFLATVRDYNLDIGDYALAVADPATTTERLVAMLILSKAPTPASAIGRNEPTLAVPAADDPLFQPAAPRGPTESASKNGIRRTSGEDDRAGK
jgi:hypothetical protein